MGALTRNGDFRRVLLEDEHVVGRGLNCSLKLTERYISAQHAVIRWNGTGWELRDLGSLNGTYLMGERIATGKGYPLRADSKIAFGNLEQEWELTDATAPLVMVVSLSDDAVILPDADMIAIPSANDPLATIYRDADGQWVLEQQLESAAPIANRQTFDVGGFSYRFCCPATVCKTSFAGQLDVDVEHITLSFSVSLDEEHVQLIAGVRGEKHDLGARNHNYLLLTLARRRLADMADGTVASSAGWMYQEDLEHALGADGPQVNLDVYRIRRAFAGLGLVDTVSIIERRPRTRQLRIGTGHLTIESV